MTKQPQKSLDDCLIQIHRELAKVNMAVNDKRWSSALAGLDHIVEHANDAFDLIGKMDAQSSKD
jgi:hypothetical protein